MIRLDSRVTKAWLKGLIFYGLCEGLEKRVDIVHNLEYICPTILGAKHALGIFEPKPLLVQQTLIYSKRKQSGNILSSLV